MKNHKLSIITFITSLAIAAVAAWYSIIGLTAIFSAAVIPIIIMGIVLEIGKLVAASWVYTHWKDTSILLRAYLVSAVAILMLITSMGIYGFLSKSHIDAGVGTNQTYVKVERLDSRIQSEQRVVDRADKQLRTLDDALERYIELGVVSKGLRKREEQEPERKLLQATITKSQNKIDIYLDEKSEYELEIKNFETEIGPLKYIAALIYGDEAGNYLDNAVRYIILLLIFVFDPLAVLLLIAANQSYRKEKPVEEEKPLPVNVGKTVRSATVNKGVKKVTKEKDGIMIHYFEEDDGKG